MPTNYFFRPNMTPSEIADLDRQRGQNNESVTDPQNKKPWAKKAADMDKMKWPEDAEDLSKVSKSACKEHGADNCTQCAKVDAKLDTLIALEAEEHGEATKKAIDVLGQLKKCNDGVIKLDEESYTEKALTTRSMHIPRPHSFYDPFGIEDSTKFQITRGISAIKGPDGVAPLVGDTFADLAENERKQTTAYKSCVVHGIIHKSDRQCHLCTVQKSSECSKCGSYMHKSFGGILTCPRNC